MKKTIHRTNRQEIPKKNDGTPKQHISQKETEHPLLIPKPQPP
jgi:hypothetical protein